jgi:hypothetical protein
VGTAGDPEGSESDVFEALAMFVIDPKKDPIPAAPEILKKSRREQCLSFFIIRKFSFRFRF